MEKKYKEMVVFDLDDTLHLRSAPFSDAVKEFLGVTDEKTLGKMFADFREIGVEYFHQWDAGTITEQEMYIRRTIDTFALYGYTVTREESADFHRTYEKYLRQIHPAEGIESALQTASERGIGLGILTNGSPVRQRGKIEALGLTRWIPEENIAVSLELGVHKPDPEVFARYQEKICGNTKEKGQDDPAAQPNPECRWWYVGDLYEHDIEPAAKAGWLTIWMVRDDEDSTVQREWEPDHIVRSGKELEELLRKIGEGQD